MIIESALGMYVREPEIIIKKLYTYLRFKDLDKVLSYYDDNAKLKKNKKTTMGHKKIKENILQIALHIHLQEIYCSGDTVFVKGRDRSDQIEGDFLHMHKIKNGKIIYSQIFNNF
ncbi:MAG: hypothetical protein CFH19_00065 [Alphaproteobacteria bacterium MarineAlpha5_Bin9]|nr:MAG: hypothetical protein CFH19_00065 [Alphaproteobacteria bacterium MarineAlpha5_Bin9]|tara:strand:- start:5584 stop:5928 length:345 start_codon:yes stop_codon:yes gene_type:complete